MKCPVCQSENPVGSKYCNSCGRGMDVSCPECGKSNPPASNFCNECGVDLRKRAGECPIDFSQPQSYTPRFLAEKILNSRSSIEGVRKAVTVLSADVAHFTSISEKLDPEEVHDLMNRCFKVLMDVVHRYEGTINQFLGDGIMAIFGAPVTHEDHAQRACSAALAIQKALVDCRDQFQKEYGIDFRMRVGLNTGQVVVGSIGDDLRMDYTAMADTTNIACVLQQSAQPGQIILSDRTQRMIKGHFDCEWLGEKKLKHRKQPVKFCELKEERARRSRLEVKEEEKALFDFVDRSEEKRLMSHLLARARRGEGQVLCLVGDAGQGKSRLVYEFKKNLLPEDVIYLESQCISYGQNVPYYPVVEILKKTFGISELDGKEKIRRILEVGIKRLDKKLVSAIPVIYRLFSLETEQDPSKAGEPEALKDVTFEALRLLILSGSQVKPLILVVENLQWIDGTSEEFLNYVVESIPSFPVLLIFTYRVGYDHSFGARSYLTQVSLSGLSDKHSQKLLKSLVPNTRVPRELARQILSKAEGNPLYLEEIVKSMIEKGVLLQEGEGYRLTRKPQDIEIPESLQDIVLARVDRLEEDSKKTIQTASVIGREFTLQLLANKEELERQLETHIRELKGLELIREKQLAPEIEYIFKDAVTKDVIYSSLLHKNRRELHMKIARAIESLYSEKKENYLDMLAYHYLHSGDVEKAVSYLIQAGDKAKSIYGNREAIAYYQQALALMVKHRGSWQPYELKAREMLGDLHDLTGDYHDALKHYGRGAKLARTEMERVEFLRKIGMVHEKKGELDEALKSYAEAMASLSPKENPLETGRVYLNIGWIHNRKGDHEKAIDFCNRALRLFEQEKRDYERALALNNLAVIHEFQGDWGLAEKYNMDSIGLMKKIGDQRKLGSFYNSMGLLAWKKGMFQESKEHFMESLLLMESIGHTLGIANAALNLGKVYLSVGSLDEAFASLERSLSLFKKMGSKSKLCQNYIELAEAYLKTKDIEKARDFCEKGMDIAAQAPYLFDQGRIHMLLGEMETVTEGVAEDHYTKSMEIFKSLGRKYECARVMEKMAALKAPKGEEELARVF